MGRALREAEVNDRIRRGISCLRKVPEKKVGGMRLGEQEGPVSVKAGKGGQAGDTLSLSRAVGRAPGLPAPISPSCTSAASIFLVCDGSHVHTRRPPAHSSPYLKTKFSFLLTFGVSA